MQNSIALAADPIAVLAEHVVGAVEERLGALTSPWLSKAEAIEYTKLRPGTFRDLAASGRIPSHGGKTKVFHRDELDRALASL